MQNQLSLMTMVNLVTMVIMVMLLSVISCQAKLIGDNVCTRQELESKMINTTYLEAVRIKKHYVCITPPFVCAEWKNTMETRWKLENVTRRVNKEDCCSGFKEDGGQVSKKMVGHAGQSAPAAVRTVSVLLQRPAPASQGSVESLVRWWVVLVVGGVQAVPQCVCVKMVDTATL